MEAMGAGNTKGGEFISHLPKSWKSLTPFLPSLLFSLSLPSLPRPPPFLPLSLPLSTSPGLNAHPQVGRGTGGPGEKKV